MALDTNVTTLNTNAMTLDANVKTHNTNDGTLDTNVTSHDSGVMTLGRSVTTLDINVTTLDTTVSTAASSVASFAAVILTSLPKSTDMKKSILSLAVIFFAAAVSCLAQPITITSTDMPSVNDVYVVNSATPSATIDPVPTGANHGWDFASLTSTTQNTDTFKSLFGIGSIYAAAFIGSSYGLRSAQDINLGVFTMEKIFNLFKNSTAKYEGSGQGAEINSIPTPMVFNPRDVIYKFPLNYGDADSASSEFNISVSTLITYRKFRTRVNVVDGWGMLDLPSGSYEALRVKSIVTDRDSIVVNGFALPIIPNVTTEYKWLGKQQGEPLLQINAGQLGVTQVLYLDNPVIGVEEISGLGFSVTTYPNPASGEFIIHSAAQGKIDRVEIYDSFGKKVYVEEPEAANGKAGIVINTSDLSDGIYFLKIASGKNTAYKKFIVAR